MGGARYCFPFRCIFPFHLGLRSRLFRSLLIPISSDGQKASKPCNNNDSNNKRTHKTKVGGDRKRLWARIEKNHQKRTPQEVYRLLLLISRSAATGEKGKNRRRKTEKRREKYRKYPERVAQRMLWRPLTSPIGCWLLECVHRLHSTSQNTHTHGL